MHPACPNKKPNHLQNSFLRRTQYSGSGKPSQNRLRSKRASLVVRERERKKGDLKHLSVYQWLRSAIPDSQQPTSLIGFLFLKLLTPPCAVLLVPKNGKIPFRMLVDKARPHKRLSVVSLPCTILDNLCTTHCSRSIGGKHDRASVSNSPLQRLTQSPGCFPGHKQSSFQLALHIVLLRQIVRKLRVKNSSQAS